jgi:hypothetical protein
VPCALRVQQRTCTRLESRQSRGPAGQRTRVAVCRVKCLSLHQSHHRDSTQTLRIYGGQQGKHFRFPQVQDGAKEVKTLAFCNRWWRGCVAKVLEHYFSHPDQSNLQPLLRPALKQTRVVRARPVKSPQTLKHNSGLEATTLHQRTRRGFVGITFITLPHLDPRKRSSLSRMIRNVVKKSMILTYTGASLPQLPSALVSRAFSLQTYFNASTIQQPSFQQQRWMTTEENVTKSTTTTDQIPLVYQSPLGSVVAKLRTVSLMTAIIGSTGVPCMIAIKGAVPEVGMLAVALTFVAGSIGSTAAIHFVFSPYVYRIESIPVRQCKKIEGEGEIGSDPGSCKSNDVADVTPATPRKKEMLLRAWTRSLFLRHVDVVFDPEIDVVPYTGLRPLCNFRAKGIPLYVHPGMWHSLMRLG